MARIISTTASSYVKSINGGQNNGIYDITYKQDLYRYQLLYDSVISQMNTYINYFSKGKYDLLINSFTTKNYNSLILKADAATFNSPFVNSLTGYEYDPKKFNLMRESTYKVINGLEKTITIVKQNQILQEDIVILKTNYKDVLEDPVKLNNYINQHKRDIMPFQATETFNTTLELKPWYSVYFQKYGAPGNGVFQSDLLAQIVIDLIAAEVITEDDFINDT